MGGDLDHSDFVDPDFEPRQRPGGSPTVAAIGSGAGAGRPPSREEINRQVTVAQQALVELRQRQEELERERTQLEESRRRRLEYEQGREEMLAHLTRGVGLLDEAEQAARRDAEQYSRSLTELRTALEKVSALREESWTADNYSIELNRALATLENARMEWNAAQLKWPVLAGHPDGGPAHTPVPAANPRGGASFLEAQSPGDLARIGLALTWPVAVAVLAVGLVLAFVLARP